VLHQSNRQDSVSFDLSGVAAELDRNSRPARFATWLLPSVVVGVSSLFFAIFWPLIRTNSLNDAGWAALVMLWGFSGFMWLRNRQVIWWGTRRAGTSVTIGDSGLIIQYPGASTLTLGWREEWKAVQLVDLTEAVLRSGGVKSTSYFLSDRDRLTALTPEAYNAILDLGRVRGVVGPGKLRGSLFFPSRLLGRALSITGISSADR
jgi:hypothetical protein